MMTATGAVSLEPNPEYSDADRIARARRFCGQMRTRRACRAFREEPVPREVIEAAILAADSAPHGGTQQPWHFVAVSAPEAKSAIRIAIEEQDRDFFRLRGGPEEKIWLEVASWLILVFTQRATASFSPSAIRQSHLATESTSIAVGLLLATLHEAGVATLAHRPEPNRFLNRVCRRPDSDRPLMIIAAGHPAEQPVTALRGGADRRPLDQIASWL